MDDLLSIIEFAEIVGVKRQGIYKQATNSNSRLYPYVVLKMGKRYIKREALREIYQIEQTKQPEEETKPNEEPNEENQQEQPEQPKQPDQPNETTSQTNQNNHQAGETEQGILYFLQQQLLEKDRQLKEKDNQIRDLMNLLNQEQRLNAQRLLTAQPNEEPEEKQEIEIIEQNHQETRRKKWWERLFDL